jgi:hypothetical protein
VTRYRILPDAGGSSSGAHLVVTEALVAMRWWRGILLHRRTPATTTPLERFTIELALRLGRADPDEFFEITGLPATLLPVAARRLVTAGALRPSGDGFDVVVQIAEPIAATHTVYATRPEPFDLVLLPRSGDLVALPPRTSWLMEADKARPRPVGQAPVPPNLRGRTLADVLTDRLAAAGGADPVPGLGADITGVAPQPGPAPAIDSDGWCPVFRVSAEVRTDGPGEPVPVLTLPGTGERTVTAPLPGATGLVRDWLEPVDELGTTAARAQLWNEVTGSRDWVAPRAERVAPDRWRCWAKDTDAARVADRPHNLAVPVGVEIQAAEVVIRVGIELAPADQAATARIALDHALSTAAQPCADLREVPSDGAARERAWRLGFHRLVYALREREDFAYD